MRAFWRKPSQKRLAPIGIEGGLKLKMAKPPVYDDVSVAFGIKPEAYFTYGDSIYCVDVPFPPGEIVEHERVHMKQQLAMLGPDAEPTEENYIKGAELWWGKFLRDPQFRVEQEAEAYARQYDVVCKVLKGRNERFMFLRQLAGSLSGPLYKNAIGLMPAIALIKKYSKTP